MAYGDDKFRTDCHLPPPRTLPFKWGWIWPWLHHCLQSCLCLQKELLQLSWHLDKFTKSCMSLKKNDFDDLYTAASVLALIMPCISLCSIVFPCAQSTETVTRKRRPQGPRSSVILRLTWVVLTWNTLMLTSDSPVFHFQFYVIESEWELLCLDAAKWWKETSHGQCYNHSYWQLRNAD